MITIFALLLAAQAPEWNCENPQAQQEMNYCAGQDFERADRDLNAAYRAAITEAQAVDRDENYRVQGDTRPGEEATLREAQRAWLAFRDAHCRLEGYEARGGSMEPMLYEGCRAALTQARAAQLRGPNPDCPDNASREDLNRCLTGQFGRADAELDRQWQAALGARRQGDAPGAARLQAAQRAWLAYRDAHCETAANAELGPEIAATQTVACRTALTEARTRELADIAALAEQ